MLIILGVLIAVGVLPASALILGILIAVAWCLSTVV